MTRIRHARLVLPFCFGVAIAGCKKNPPASPASQPAPASTSASSAVKPADPPLVTSVSGVPGSTSESGSFAPLTRTSPSKEYGYTAEQAVKTAGLSSDPVQSEHVFMRSLRGPKGEVIRYRRLGSCCAFKLEGAAFGGGLLDVYEVTYDGLAAPLKLYLNMYQRGDVFVPQGLTARPGGE